MNTLKELRKEHNFTEDVVAKKLNITIEKLMKIENGVELPDVRMVTILAALYGVNIGEVMLGVLNKE